MKLLDLRRRGWQVSTPPSLAANQVVLYLTVPKDRPQSYRHMKASAHDLSSSASGVAHVGVIDFRSHAPGSFLAKVTRLPRFSWVLTYRAHDGHIPLHGHYGPMVRFGPHMANVRHPREFGTTYDFELSWRKASLLKTELEVV